MSSFVQYIQAARSASPDTSKHVSYNMGMVLGVDDFTQEFAYLSGHDEWALRDLIGYGTASGLRVYLDIASGAAMLVVTKGTAVSPRGQLIKVEPDQCVDLNKWLLKYKDKVDASVGVLPINATPPLRLYLVLLYRECPTDLVPIPGEPCRSDDETRAPSRLKDDFKLELRFRPPNQYEEDAVRDFVTWLGEVEITEDPLGTYPTVGEFIEEIRRAAHALPVPVTSPPLSPPASPPGSPPESPPASPPDYLYGSPPAPWRIHVSQACDYLRAAFRVWVTELRPLWQRSVPPGTGCEDYSNRPDNPDDGALLLAELTVPLVRSSLAGAPLEWQVSNPAAVAVSEERRPYLVHLRMLQEWLMCGRAPILGGGGDTVISPPSGVGPHDHAALGDVIGQVGSNTVVGIGGKTVDLSEPLQEGQVLTYEQATDHWKPKPVPPPGPQPIPPLAGDAVGDVGSNTVVGIGGKTVDLSEPLQDGQVLTYIQADDHWKPTPLPPSVPQPIPPLGGDLRGTVDNASLEAIKSVPVVGADPVQDEGKVLRLVGGQWRPDAVAIPAPGGDLSGTLPTARVIRIQNVPVVAPNPANDAGKFLRFVNGQWQADNVAVPPAQTPGGDLSGALPTAKVVGIQNVPVVAPNLANDAGKFLRLVNGQWQADNVAPSNPPIPGGDLSGTVVNAKVVGLQGLPVTLANPGTDDGKVLRLVGGQWRPDVVPVPAPPAPGGDLSGTIANANVIRIQNVPVTAAHPLNDLGKFMRFIGGQWRPDTVPVQAPPVPGGDLSGTVANANVIRIQNVPVSGANPGTDEGKFLRLVGGQWRPASLNIPDVTDFVQHPQGAGPFGIVAAGIMQATRDDGSGNSARKPGGYNKLQVIGVQQLLSNNLVTGVRLTLLFDTYRPPDGEFQYIVKALPVFNENLKLPPFVANFERFLSDNTPPDAQDNRKGFILLLTPMSRDFQRDNIPRLEVMVEVSMYPFKE